MPNDTSSEDLTDDCLVINFQQGDEAAFEVLWRRYISRVRAIVNRFTRVPADTEDLVQETFLRAYTGLAKFRGDSQFYTWLYKIAFNTGINFSQSKARLLCTNVEMAEELDSNSPENATIAEQCRRKINQTLRSMPVMRRETLTLITQRGYDYKTASRLLCCPLGTVRSRISRAREDLALALGV